MLHISLVGIGGDKIAEGTWPSSCKMLELFNIARRSKPGLRIQLLHGSLKLNPQMSLGLLEQDQGSVLLTVLCCIPSMPKSRASNHRSQQTATKQQQNNKQLTTNSDLEHAEVVLWLLL
ncbi:unnamed protein product [Polarella glacialis]|uniref:Uncharacterized protein n=1 Tax=Polarella glacialis TaxID=89957 RepID=A0A813GIF7_POLGL|nr:unnamed protein product [Polarella glacialis]